MAVRSENWKRRVILHGDLGEKFGREFELAVETPNEAFRALCTNFPEMQRHIYTASQRGVGYAVILNERNGREKYSLKQNQLAFPLGSKTLEIVPMPLGAGRNPLLFILVGALIIGGLGAFGLIGIAEGGLLAAGLEFGNLAVQIAFTIGVGLILGGISQLLAPTPDGPTDEGGGQTRKASYQFSGAVNSTGQGEVVPMGYGRVLVGSHVISAGVTTFATTGDGEPVGGTSGFPGYYTFPCPPFAGSCIIP